MTNHPNPNSAAQAAKAQPVLSFDERERILCQFMREPINHDREMAIAIETAVLSKLRAPVADERAAFKLLDAWQAVCDRIVDQYGGVVAGVDFAALGRANRAALASAPVVDETALRAWADRFPEISDMGRLRDAWNEARASAPVAGEARCIGYIDYKGKNAGHARAVLTTGYDENGNAWADGTKFYAASQASAEDVCKVRADAFIAGFICAGGDAEEAKRQAPQFQACVDAGRKHQPQADKDGCTRPSGDGSLRHPCPMHPAADKDGGQQRAAGVDQAQSAERDMLEEARAEIEMIREALGVSYEPHQSLFDRMLEACDGIRHAAKARGMLEWIGPDGKTAGPALVADVPGDWVRCNADGANIGGNFLTLLQEIAEDAPQAEQGERDE